MAKQSKVENILQMEEIDLLNFSLGIDGVLRKHFATRALKDLIDTNNSTPSWPVGLSLVSGIVTCLLLRKYLPVIGWFAIIPALFVVWRVELLLSMLWAKTYFKKFKFRLMRHEQKRDDEKRPDRYIVSYVPGNLTGFGFEHWMPARGVLPGHMVVSISNADYTKAALIHLRTEGNWLAVTAWEPNLYKDNLLPPVPKEVIALVDEFDKSCDLDILLDRKKEDRRALFSKKFLPKPRDVEQVWKAVTIAPEVKTRLISLAKHFAEGSPAASRGLLLFGPPGTGKTLIAKALAESMGCEFIALSLPDLKAGYVGQSGEKVKALWRQALSHPRAVLFIDECEGVFSRRGGVKSDSFSEEIVQAFLSEWDGFSKQNTVWVVGATNRRDLIDPAIISRFGETIEIGLPGKAQRVQILNQELTRKGVSKSLPPAVGDLTQGMSGRDLETLAGRLAREQSGGEITDAILSGYTQAFRKQGSTQTDSNKVWENLILPDKVMKQLKTTAQVLKQAEAVTKRGFSVPSGLLLYGPPGTGKTEIARTMANETGLGFIAATTADIKGGFTGQSGQKVQELFQRAREASPCILFLDELDIVAPIRGAGNGDAFTQEIIGQLLQEMNGVKSYSQTVFVLAASNCIDRIDAAVRSRFQTTIEIPLPDLEGRKRLLLTLLKSKPVAFELGPTSELIAHHSEGMSGRSLANWIKRAESYAMGRAAEAGNLDQATLTLKDFTE